MGEVITMFEKIAQACQQFNPTGCAGCPYYEKKEDPNALAPDPDYCICHFGECFEAEPGEIDMNKLKRLVGIYELTKEQP